MSLTQLETIDARGLMCPEPVRLAEIRMKSLQSGQVLAIWVTDPAGPLDFEAWCIRRRHQHLSCKDHPDGSWEIRVRKAG